MERKEIARGRAPSMLCMVELMTRMDGSWALTFVVFIRDGGALQGDSGFSG